MHTSFILSVIVEHTSRTTCLCVNSLLSCKRPIFHQLYVFSVPMGRPGCALPFRQVSTRWCCSAAGSGGTGSASTRSSMMLTGSPSPSANWLPITSGFTVSRQETLCLLRCICSLSMSMLSPPGVCHGSSGKKRPGQTVWHYMSLWREETW